MIRVLAIIGIALVPMPCIAGDQLQQIDELREPERGMPHPLSNPVAFKIANKREQQSLEIKFLDSKTVSFRLNKTGKCDRHEEGTAKIKPYWWLGAESDENEAREAVGVTEYVYERKGKCSMYFRVDDDFWQQAIVRESKECNKNCPVSNQRMHLNLSQKKR